VLLQQRFNCCQLRGPGFSSNVAADLVSARLSGREEVAELQRMSSPQLLAALARDPLASLDPEPSGHSPCHSSDAAARLWQPAVHLRCTLILVAFCRAAPARPGDIVAVQSFREDRMQLRGSEAAGDGFSGLQQAPSEAGWFEGELKAAAAAAGGPSSRGNSNASSMDILPPHHYSSEAASPPASPPMQHRDGFQLPSPGREPAPHSPHLNDAYFSGGLHSRAVRTGSSQLREPQPNTLQVSALNVLLCLLMVSGAGQHRCIADCYVLAAMLWGWKFDHNQITLSKRRRSCGR
jgi:hypothetical protein